MEKVKKNLTHRIEHSSKDNLSLLGKIGKYVPSINPPKMREIDSRDRPSKSGYSRQSSSSYNASNVIIRIYNISDSAKVINGLIMKTELPASLLADLFEMTAKTLARYKNEKLKLPTRHAELAVKLDMLYSLGAEIFGSTKEFNEWLKEKSYGLNDEKPIEMLNTVTGIDLVTEELRRIEFGATA